MNVQKPSKISYVLGLVVLTATSVEAGTQGLTENRYKNIEISGAGGADWYQIPSTDVFISSLETDRDYVTNISTHGAWKVGAGYYFFSQTLEQRPYLNALLFEINVYQTSTTLRGNVWQFQLPQFNNYNFDAPLTSTRLMFDIKPSLLTWHKLSPYPILGIGATWNALSYHETVTSADVSPRSALSLSSKTTSQLAWDVGAGFRAALTENLSATAEYIYAFLGHASPGSYPANGVNLEMAQRFSLDVQTILFGLTLKFQSI